MTNTSSLSFNVIDLSFSVAAILQGVSFVEGVTKRGPFADTDTLMTSWPQFEKLYGGLLSTSDFPLLCRRSLERGASLRVNRVGHYTDITDISTLDAVKAGLNQISIITFDAAFIASNQIDLDVNGVAITPVVFAVDSDTTMAALATEVATEGGVAQAVVVEVPAGTDNDRVILVFSDSGTDLVIDNIVVTLGVSQAGGVETTYTDDRIVDVVNQEDFELTPKYEGADYNNLQAIISTASNGDDAYFDLTLQHALESELTETYQNLTITGNPDVVGSDYLNDVILGSQLFDVTYKDLSATTGQQRPINQTAYYNSGTNGTAPDSVDYVGDSAGGTGFNAFDSADDAFQIAAPEISANDVHIGGAAYSANRADLQYLAHLSNSLLTPTTLIAARDATLVDSRFTMFFAGGVKVTDPLTNTELEISEIGDVLGILAFSDDTAGPWFSPAGTTRGQIPNALNVVNNYGTPAMHTQLNQLANHQINMVIVRNNRIYLVDFYTAQLANSKLSFGNHQRLLLHIQKSTSPTLERFLEEPNDIPTFRAIFRAVEPFFEALVTDRALFSYVWQGDQNVDTIDDIVVNNPTDLDNGKYRVKLFVKIVPTMKEMTISIIVTPTGTSFDILLEDQTI